ncbi:MAG: STAS domain-containing protein [Clostridiales Family XIII bacterium]|jgi:anti-sigma B factor antagonist|nr:STAS domain-containing protein [Clostridiales Family XIII bacterium]
MALSVESRLIINEREYWEVKLRGDVDIANAADFRAALREAYFEKPADIIIDASELSYIDSTGLGVIIGAYGRMRDKGHGILIENPKANVKKLLNITSLDKIFCQEEVLA